MISSPKVADKPKVKLADVTNALYENAMSGNPVSQIFFLKNRDPNRWNDVKSINHLQLNVSKMTDSQLLQELNSDPVLSSTFQNIIPQLDQPNDEVTEQLDGE